MTGLERNADIVQMCSYAPLFAHVDAWQWRPDLIWFDNLNTVATPNYYVQKLFSTNKGTDVVKILQNGNILAGKDSLYASSVIDKKTNELIVKLVNNSSASQMIELNIEGVKLAKSNASFFQLSGNDLYSYNKLDELDRLAPMKRSFEVKSNKIDQQLAPYSVNVIKLAYSVK